MDLPFAVPLWLYQVTFALLVLGPFLGRIALAAFEALGWTRAADFAHRAAPFARGFLSALLRKGPPVVAFVLVLSGCGARGGPDPASALEGARDVINAAEPCLAASHDLKIKACGEDASCLEAVRAIDDKIADGLDAFRAFWCALPNEEGCTR